MHVSALHRSAVASYHVSFHRVGAAAAVRPAWYKQRDTRCAWTAPGGAAGRPATGSLPPPAAVPAMASGALLATPTGAPVTSVGPPVTVMTVSDGGNGTNSTEWPESLLMQDYHVLKIVAYSVLILISLPANVCVIIALLRKRKQMKRLNLMLLHLAIADLMVRNGGMA